LIERRLPTATINSSVRIVASCSFSFPHELRDEVWLPGPAPIIGGRFLEILGSGAYVRPNCAEQRDPAVKHFLVIEFATTVFEFSEHRLTKLPVAAGGKRFAPLMRLRVLEKQHQRFEVPCRTVGLNLFQLRTAIPNFSHDGGSVECVPTAGTVGRLIQGHDVDLPPTEVEIKIVLRIAGI
jgi:hypothetical protein